MGAYYLDMAFLRKTRSVFVFPWSYRAFPWSYEMAFWSGRPALCVTPTTSSPAAEATPPRVSGRRVGKNFGCAFSLLTRAVLTGDRTPRRQI